MTNTPQMPQHIHPAFQKAQTTAAEQSSRALDRSTDAVDYWMTQHRNDAALDETLNGLPADASETAVILNDLHLFRPSIPVALSASLNLADAIHDVLRNCIQVMHSMDATDRGSYLAQAIGLIATPNDLHGTTGRDAQTGFDLLRFHVGHIVARYLSDHTWEQLKRAMRDRGLVRQTTKLDPRRTAIATWIWQITTHGDHTAAPMVLIAGSTKRHTGGQADLLLSLQQRSPSGMHDLIAIAAEGLAERIEHFDQPTTDCA